MLLSISVSKGNDFLTQKANKRGVKLEHFMFYDEILLSW